MQCVALSYSCKSRGLCPSCGTRRALAWAERLVEEILPDVPYVQLVFTIPIILRKSFLFDRTLYGELCRVAYSATLAFLREHFPDLEDPVPAMVASPQSFGSLININVHVHAVCSLGVFDRQGNFHPAEAIDFSPLQEIFREKTLRMMFEREKISQERLNMLRSWKNSGFSVDSSRKVEAGHRKNLESLLQYMARPPVALRRLTYRLDGMVLYQGGRYHPRLGRDHQLVTGLEFLAMLVPHIALRFECLIHSFGAISTTTRRKFGWIQNHEGEADRETPDIPVIDGEESTFVKVRKRNWARLISKVWKDDPTLCEGCGQTMKIIAAISSPGQDEVIEKILRSRREWDPPWLRRRKARGPPAAVALASPPETRIEYDPGCEPGMESWNGEVDPDWGWE